MDNILQVQPRRQSLSDFAALGVQFEIMDFAFPVYSKRDILDTYKGYVVPSMHGAFVDINFSSNDLQILELSRKKIENSLADGKLLGVKNIVLHSCFYPVLPFGSLAVQWCEESKEFFKKLIEKYDVNVFVENTLDINADVLSLLMQRCEDERINICFDVGHARLSNTPLKEWFKTLGKYIKYMHVNDNRGVTDDHLVPGEGVIAWDEVKELMLRYADNPIVTLEVSGLEKAKKSVDFWRKL